MNLTKKQRKFLKKNFKKMSDEELASHLGIPRKKVRKALSELNLIRDKESSPKKEKAVVEKKEKAFPIPRKTILILAGGVALVLLLIFAILPSLPGKSGISKKELKGLIGSVDRSKLNVLLITLDTTRADRLACYGFPEIKTPNLDKLAEEGILFEDAHCDVPLTFPSHTSIMTGTYTLHHGMKDNGYYFLPDEATTLAEILKGKGYTTGAVMGAYVLDSKWGLAQGFDFYYDSFDIKKFKSFSLGDIQRRGDEVLKHGISWLDKNKGERFFLWLHFYDPHTPYDPPEPFKSEYMGRPYIGEIAYTDMLVGKAIDYLKKNDLLDKTIIVVVGDHGESLGEHKEATHGFFIYEATTHVPLIFRFPGRKYRGERISELVRTIDITPTILNALGIPIPKEIEGRSLIPLMVGKKAKGTITAYSESYFPRFHYGWSELKAIQTRRYKYIDAPKPELYDLITDPMELNNLIEEKKDIARKLKLTLETVIKRYSQKGKAKRVEQLDPETIARLRALGYVGAGAPVGSYEGKPPDPKDKIHLFRAMGIAREFLNNKEYQLAEEKLKEIIAEDPNIVDAHFTLATVYKDLGEMDKAIAEFKETLKLKPDYSIAVFNLANTYRQMGKLDEALAGFLRLSQLNPKEYTSYVQIADIYMEKGDHQSAYKYFVKALSLKEELPLAHNGLGVIYYKRGDLARAEKEFKRAIELAPKFPKVHFNLAQLYEDKGAYEEAKKEYEKEIEYYPDNYKAHYNLGRLLGKLGDREGEIAELKKSIELSPDLAVGYLFLAKAYLDKGENLKEAISLAKKGLSLNPPSSLAPLGHYILADIYNRLGRYEEARREVALARKLETGGGSNR
ncbi:MAG: sulfatase-like hydrolase/transferase [Acidobacteria bacterium]|nr:sulfatase-like hydrolase/transferase [Acidobacteriota bacterium]